MKQALIWALLLSSAGSALGAASATGTTASEVLERAIARARDSEDNPVDAKYAFRVRTQTLKLRGPNDADSREERVWQSSPVDGVVHRRLIAKDGRSLASSGASEPVAADEKNQSRIRFDEKLVSRYVTTLVGTEDASGRQAYRLDFHPVEPLIAETTRLESVLNRVHGSVWIDARSFEVLRVDFQLVDGARVRLGPKALGWLGRLDELSGSFERAPLLLGDGRDCGDWAPSRLEVRFRGRALLRKFHVAEVTVWEAFTLAYEEGAL